MNLLHLFPLVAVVYSWYCPSAPNLPYEGEKCFHFSMRPEEFQLNFDAAQTACQKLGGSLASITSKFQYDYIKAMTQVIPNGSGYRIGLLVGYNHWMDGSILDFTKFPASAANNIGQYPTVAITKSNYETWISQPREALNGYVCSMWIRPLPTQITPTYCPNGGQAIIPFQGMGSTGCPLGFAGTLTYCCPVCKKGGVPLFTPFSNTCPTATHDGNDNCCPKNPN